MKRPTKPDLLLLRDALEASWDEKTSYLAVRQEGNPALGQCYPTSRVVQHFFPETEILKGDVWNGSSVEIHFWNGLLVNGTMYHIDFTWQQFPRHSSVRNFVILHRESIHDSEGTVRRCEILMQRVNKYIALT